MRQFINAIGCYFIYIIAYFLVIAIFYFVGAVFNISENDIDTNMVAIVSIIITTFFYSRFIPIFRNLKFTLKFSHIIILIAIGLCINFIFIMIINTDTVKYFFPSHNPKVRSIATDDNLLITIVNTGLLVPFFEELLFREIIYSQFKERFSTNVSIVFQALLFGVVHFNLLQIIYCFILGILLGKVVEKTKTLISAIIIHASISISSIIIMRL